MKLATIIPITIFILASCATNVNPNNVDEYNSKYCHQNTEGLKDYQIMAKFSDDSGLDVNTEGFYKNQPCNQIEIK